MAWSVGSFFLPGPGELKILERAGKAGEVAARVARISRLADEAEGAAVAARRAADVGDIDGAAEAAERAAAKADEAKGSADDVACSVSIGPLGGGAGPYAASVVLRSCPENGGASDVERAREAKKAAETAADDAIAKKYGLGTAEEAAETVRSLGLRSMQEYARFQRKEPLGRGSTASIPYAKLGLLGQAIHRCCGDGGSAGDVVPA